jgi:hypothetical protein
MSTQGLELYTPLSAHVLLAHLLQRARANPGQPQTCRLTSGLKVDLLAEPELLQLSISRSAFYPTPAEWRSVLRCLNIRPEVPPKQERVRCRCYLRAEWPL